MEDWVQAGILPLQIELVGGGANPGKNGERPNPTRGELVTTRQAQVTSIQQNQLPHSKLNIPEMLFKVPFLCYLCPDMLASCIAGRHPAMPTQLGKMMNGGIQQRNPSLTGAIV